jgi:hypothetical protein
MFFHPLFTALFVLIFSLHATCATINVRSVPGPNTERGLEPIAETIPPSLHAAPAAILRRPKRHDMNDQIHGVHETTIDWRENQALKLQSEREAGFLPGSHEGDNDDDDE